jgi:multidrug efflux system membrane fusion protein
VVQLVSVATIADERASISHGLSDGDRVVVNGVDRLRDGSRVEIAR